MDKRSWDEGLYMPAMPDNVFDSICATLKAELEDRFEHVALPVPGPKKEHVDIMVKGPLHDTGRTWAKDKLVKELGAERSMQNYNGSDLQLALPWPKDLEAYIPNSTETDASKAGTIAHVKVLLRICQGLEELKWFVFLKSHDQLHPELNKIMDRVRLSVERDGLVLGIEGVPAGTSFLAKRNPRRFEVVVTKDPAMVLGFLGLDADRFNRPFDTPDEILAYAMSTRFHDMTIDCSDPSDSIQKELSEMASTGAREDIIRQAVIKEAKEFFAPAFADLYDERIAVLRPELEVKLWRSIEAALPWMSTATSCVMRGLRREIAGEEVIEIVPGLSQDDLDNIRSAWKAGEWEYLHEWALENCKAVGSRQYMIDLRKGYPYYIERLKLRKIERRRPVQQVQAQGGERVG